MEHKKSTDPEINKKKLSIAVVNTITLLFCGSLLPLAWSVLGWAPLEYWRVALPVVVLVDTLGPGILYRFTGRAIPGILLRVATLAFLSLLHLRTPSMPKDHKHRMVRYWWAWVSSVQIVYVLGVWTMEYFGYEVYGKRIVSGLFCLFMVVFGISWSIFYVKSLKQST